MLFSNKLPIFVSYFKTNVMDIIVTTQQGSLLCTTIYNGEYYKRQYIGYTKAQAKKLFRAYVIALASKPV